MDKRLYTAYDLANLTGVSYQTALAWIHTGIVKAIKVGRFYRIPADEYDRISNEGIQHDVEKVV